MASTLAASAYFLSCCRPIHNSFCFQIEKPKFINFNQYPLEFFLKHPRPGCKFKHASLLDHNLNKFNSCTDWRSWSLDDQQARQHFKDLVCGRVPQCEVGDHVTQKPPEDKAKKKADLGDDEKVIGISPPEDLIITSPEGSSTTVAKSKGNVPSEASSKSAIGAIVKSESEKQLTSPSPSATSGKPGFDPSVKSIKSEKQLTSPSPSATSGKPVKLGYDPSVKSIKSEKAPPDSVDVVGLTDELLEKLDRNLRNLESTFDKFVKKNRDFIQNLVECLDFEKQKQKSLEDDYNKLKQENEALKTQNDYLKMVNNKQLDLFKNELNKEISESKVIYKRKIHLMERQLLNDQNELQTYKQTEKKYMEVVEQDNEKIEKLNNKIDDLKNKEMQLVRNYLQLLKFLGNVKDILMNADPRDIPQLKSLNTVTNSEGENDPDVKRVLRNALNNGILALNVRDLSILHDAIEGINNGLCHQTDKCTKSTAADSSFEFSNMSIHRIVIEHSHDDVSKQFEDYNALSNLSVDQFPIRQMAEDRKVHF